MLRGKKEEARIHKVIQDNMVENQHHSKFMLKLFIVVLTALLCTIGSFVGYYQPNFMNKFSKKPIPPFHLTTRYPASVIVERDLPRFFRQYSIATPDNVVAQDAVRKVLRSRQQLRQRSAGRIKSTLKAWDDSNVEQLIRQGVCGDDFAVAYSSVSQQQTKDDLLMWCLMAARATEGFFMESVEILDSPLFLTRNRGIVVKKQSTAGLSDGDGALSTSFYIHPRSNTNDASAVNWIPAKVLTNIISSSKEDVLDEDNIRNFVERMLYDLVVTQGHEKDFLILEEVCQDSRPERSIAIDTSKDSNVCYFVLPKPYGGNFQDDD